MKIEKIEENKEIYIDLLLEADPDENVVKKYIDNKVPSYCKNFFIDNYEKEIWDGNLQCIDMYYYYKELN